MDKVVLKMLFLFKKSISVSLICWTKLPPSKLSSFRFGVNKVKLFWWSWGSDRYLWKATKIGDLYTGWERFSKSWSDIQSLVIWTNGKIHGMASSYEKIWSFWITWKEYAGLSAFELLKLSRKARPKKKTDSHLI